MFVASGVEIAQMHSERLGRHPVVFECEGQFSGGDGFGLLKAHFVEEGQIYD